jgi:hypothetical protein
MIAPIMRQSLEYKELVEGRDEYGRPQVSEEPKKSKCRTTFKTEYVRTADGVTKEVNVEIDVPPGVKIPDGTKITFTDAQKDSHTGQIEGQDEAKNFSGSRVIFKTLYVGVI